MAAGRGLVDGGVLYSRCIGGSGQKNPERCSCGDDFSSIAEGRSIGGSGSEMVDLMRFEVEDDVTGYGAASLEANGVIGLALDGCPFGQSEGLDRDRLLLKHRQSRVALQLVTFVTCGSSKLIGVMGSQPMQSSVHAVGVSTNPDPGSRVFVGNGRIPRGAKEVASRAAKCLLEARWQPMVVYTFGEVESMASVFGSEAEGRQIGVFFKKSGSGS
ncbi:hypothetical protein NE237_032134 [Protea cynaroides]|uniref:Uncharacterized protein n=1 Tax=Protea cynaroides TaxID=273540 RepID=A0A9Q0R361_9MAGN|nr:hypothetical protein NE237_032134 [Protea cynaroides]